MSKIHALFGVLSIQLRCRAIPPPRLRQVGCEVDGWICGVVGGPVPTRNLPVWESRGRVQGGSGASGGVPGHLGGTWGVPGGVLDRLGAFSWGRLGPRVGAYRVHAISR